jgi:phosphatidylserine/phosphatidylglycerophosphate/cardiolipin synthase-like enzyme
VFARYLSGALPAVPLAAALLLGSAEPAQAYHTCFTGPPAAQACNGALLAMIGAEGTAIDVALLRWFDDAFTTALIDAKRRGARVRVRVDWAHLQFHDQTRRGVGRLLAAGVPVVTNRHNGKVHHKWVHLYGQGRLVVMTYHPNAGISDWENHHVVTSAGGRAHAREHFDRLWASSGATGVSERVTQLPPYRAERPPGDLRSGQYTCFPAPPRRVSDEPAQVCFTGDANCLRSLLGPMIDAEPPGGAVDVATWALWPGIVYDALVRLLGRGGRVRVLHDGATVREQPEAARALEGLRAAGARVRVDQLSRSLHQKTTVLHGTRRSATMTSNHRGYLSPEVRGCGTQGWSENIFLVDNSPRAFELHQARFGALWSSGYFR